MAYIILAPSQSKNEQKLPRIMNKIPSSLALQFGENFMNIRPKKQVTDVYIHTLMHIFFLEGLKI